MNQLTDQIGDTVRAQRMGGKETSCATPIELDQTTDTLFAPIPISKTEQFKFNFCFV
jgi:hypothetical protein